MAGESRRREILIHEAIDDGAKEVGTAALGTGEEIPTCGVVGPPDGERLLHIRGQIDDAIDSSFALVDAHCVRVQVNGVPGEGIDLGDPQPTAQHEKEDEPVTDRVNDLKEGSQIGIRDRFRQHCRCQEPVSAPQDRLLRHLAFFMEILKEARQETDFRINGRWGEPSCLRGGNERGDVLGGRLGEVLGEDDLALLG